jgi:predicted HicB family RNase H-like nuclease
LEQEASAEGVSLNQLVVAKLAIPLDKTAAKRLRAG